MLDRLLRIGEGRAIKRLGDVVSRVNSLSDEYEKLTDAELRAKTDEFKKRHEDGESLDDLLTDAFATAREASRRVLSQRHFDVQVMGGAALHYGNIAEMKTGEGKTLTCVLPAYLNALTGEGVHVVTTNDYLAKRDSEWMGRVHRFLGLSVGAILAGGGSARRREAYHADITYGTNNEFGFDYLRDNMAHNVNDLVQRGHSFAIVDEVDSILIDEARTPLIISGPADSSSKWYVEFARIAERMQKDVHYEVDLRKRTIGVSEAGVGFVEDQLGIGNLYEAANSALVSYLNNAVKAKELFTRDKDYLVQNGEVLIVDEHTGRLLVGRRYNEGLHQAIEAKENVEVKAENQTFATITLQNYFRLYDKLAGMTGTARTEASEFQQIYKLGVVSIPTNRSMIRTDQADLIYRTQEAKFDAVVKDVAERHEKGQPVLIGTTSVERSETLSRLLKKSKVPHTVLNAKYHEQEAAIIARAGQLGAVTVATNMAGRGTDIVLGGNVDVIADQRLREQGLDPVNTPEEYEAQWESTLTEVKEEAEKQAEKVREAGGLYVLGTERHESRRIDNQLRGRAGRQGDPGESRFYLSLGDELMRRFNQGILEFALRSGGQPDDVPLEHKLVTRAIKTAQTDIEQMNFESRKNVLKYDDVMNEQRKVIYAERRRILEGEDLGDQVQHMITDTITAYVNGATAEGYAEDWDLGALWAALRTLYPVGITQEQAVPTDKRGQRKDVSAEELLELLLEDARAHYKKRTEEINSVVGEDGMAQLERMIMLQVLDRKWREHLYEMDYLKEGIGLRAMAQRDPLVEYQREGFDMFTGMLDGLKEEVVGFLFNVSVTVEAPPSGPAQPAQAEQEPSSGEEQPQLQVARALEAPSEPEEPLTYTAPGEDGSAVVSRSPAPGELGPGTRRERRAAARDQTKGGRGLRRGR
ncbi:preprotein translocase subunit SecA [Segniliparus rugosus]|uniref:preprotein translocase subunit SecA n=1 Tax=Segniliparus rugosus TaxID=286804 RepID=UPI00058F3362|nr:preprotein translocase subunit SecA [Segniliparus rugosus]